MNNDNLKRGKATQFKSGDEAARNGKKGGIASGEARRERATIADVLRRLLDEADESGITRREHMVENVVKRVSKKGEAKDLKAVAEILGELNTDINIKSNGLPVPPPIMIEVIDRRDQVRQPDNED